jgi:hypothetical protein
MREPCPAASNTTPQVMLSVVIVLKEPVKNYLAPRSPAAPISGAIVPEHRSRIARFAERD